MISFLNMREITLRLIEDYEPQFFIQRARENEYIKIKMIKDQNYQVFVQPQTEYEYYTVDFLEDIYDMFAQRINRKLAQLQIMKYMICDKLLTKNS